MSIVTPNPAPIIPAVQGGVMIPTHFTPWSDITSFTYRTGMTHQALVESMRVWLHRVLLPAVNDGFATMEEGWEIQVNALIAAVQSFIDTESAGNDAKIADALTAIANADIQITDPAILAVLNDDTSATLAKLRTLFVVTAEQYAEELAAALAAPTSDARDYLDARYRDAILIPVGTDSVPEYADTIQAALDTGKNVGVVNTTGSTVGVAKIAHTLRMSTQQGQRLFTRGAVLYPTFLGDTVQMVTRQFVDVEIDGSLQPVGDDANSAGIRIGSTVNGWNPQQGSVAGSLIRSYKGYGIFWEDGSMIDFTHAAVYNATRDGIGTANGTDNNHGWFANTHVVNCGGAGYAIHGDGSNLDAGGSRHHVFQDAKAFGCRPNFLIETRSNVGTVFSEQSVIPDHFTSTSRGNRIAFNETAATFESVIDDAPVGVNEISGFSMNNKWETKELSVRALTVGINQPTNKSTRISEWISGKYSTGAVVIGAGASVTLDPGVTGGGDGRSVDTALFAADPAGYVIQPFFDAAGNMKFTVFNTQNTSRTLNGTISYSIKRFA